MLKTKLLADNTAQTAYINAREFAQIILTDYFNEENYYTLPGKLNLTQQLFRRLFLRAVSGANMSVFLLRKIADASAVQNYNGFDYFGRQAEIFADTVSPSPRARALKPAFNLVCVEIERQIKEMRALFYSFPPDKNPLLKLYARKGYDLNKAELDNNYGLMSVSAGRELLENTPRLWDKNYSISVNLNGIEPEIYRMLRGWQAKYHFELAVRPDPLGCFNTLETRGRLAEAVEYGPKFDLSRLDTRYFVTKLYNQSNDNFWVKISGQEITFEEILNDFPEYQNNICTRAFHLIADDAPQGKIITHLDQEFFIYTLEEFVQRQTNAAVKGKGMPRVKIFKIDNADIPFDIEKILLPLLLAGFQNKELALEYFNVSP
ncbi:MAG: hypothetical protein LBD99_03470 [Candidatus Margulisbacteria bacterium]|jgi:hypothetical protein|nr:hypothetical protein [Candidatus Margulisiibacteriota bacterium]